MGSKPVSKASWRPCASFWPNMSPWRAMATPFVTKNIQTYSSWRIYFLQKMIVDHPHFFRTSSNKSGTFIKRCASTSEYVRYLYRLWFFFLKRVMKDSVQIMVPAALFGAAHFPCYYNIQIYVFFSEIYVFYEKYMRFVWKHLFLCMYFS